MAARTRAQRRIDTLDTLRRGGNAWVATASADGKPHLVALTYFWDGERLTMATRVRSKTARNLTRGRWARVALVLTGDAVILEGPVEVIPLDAGDGLGDGYAAATGYDVRQMREPRVLFRLTPTNIKSLLYTEE